MKSLLRPRMHAVSLFGLFGFLTVLVINGALLLYDEAPLLAIAARRTPLLTDWMLAFTFLGHALVEVPMAFLVAWILWRLGRGAHANRYLLSGVLGELFYVVLKASIGRERPSIVDRLGDAGWYSYPSGHTMLGPILWSFGFLLVADAIANRVVQGVLVLGAIVIPILIGVSRVYLGVHYPSDVLGALLVGSAWVVWWWPRSSDGASAASTSSTPAIK